MDELEGILRTWWEAQVPRLNREEWEAQSWELIRRAYTLAKTKPFERLFEREEVGQVVACIGEAIADHGGTTTPYGAYFAGLLMAVALVADEWVPAGVGA